MTGTAARQQKERASHSSSSDEKLIKACLKGDAEAWAALIDKYKNLIYSIPVKFGMYQDAADIFQAVCVDLMSELPNLREHRALPKWLIQTCYHRCLQQRRLAGRQVELEPEQAEKPADNAEPALPEQMLVQLEQEQLLRDVIAEMPERCERMIQMLFFETPARPYDEVAKELGLATGSIGFIRGRCLAQLKKQLEKKGF
ncbi:MAG: sigma-70 family RNA polymerase sigma factor [Terriglobales bacterium]|jgi:RNA polymerase sigma factor (sigma-70 family)